MTSYRITVDNLDNVADEPTVTVIECSTRYDLRDALREWVLDEVDPDAEVSDVPRPPEVDPDNFTEAFRD